MDYFSEPEDLETKKIRKVQEKCNCPSFMCPICHRYQDNTRSYEYIKIKQLTDENNDLRKKLKEI